MKTTSIRACGQQALSPFLTTVRLPLSRFRSQNASFAAWTQRHMLAPALLIRRTATAPEYLGCEPLIFSATAAHDSLVVGSILRQNSHVGCGESQPTRAGQFETASTIYLPSPSSAGRRIDLNRPNTSSDVTDNEHPAAQVVVYRLIERCRNENEHSAGCGLDHISRLGRTSGVARTTSVEWRIRLAY